MLPFPVLTLTAGHGPAVLPALPPPWLAPGSLWVARSPARSPAPILGRAVAGTRCARSRGEPAAAAGGAARCRRSARSPPLPALPAGILLSAGRVRATGTGCMGNVCRSTLRGWMLRTHVCTSRLRRASVGVMRTPRIRDRPGWMCAGRGAFSSSGTSPFQAASGAHELSVGSIGWDHNYFHGCQPCGPTHPAPVCVSVGPQGRKEGTGETKLGCGVGVPHPGLCWCLCIPLPQMCAPRAVFRN